MTTDPGGSPGLHYRRMFDGGVSPLCRHVAVLSKSHLIEIKCALYNLCAFDYAKTDRTGLMEETRLLCSSAKYLHLEEHLIPLPKWSDHVYVQLCKKRLCLASCQGFLYCSLVRFEKPDVRLMPQASASDSSRWSAMCNSPLPYSEMTIIRSVWENACDIF